MTEIKQDYEERWPHLDIHYLVLFTNDFIVFIDSDLDIDWKTSDEYDQKGPEKPEKHNLILNRAATLECIPNEHQKKTVRLNFKRMLAEGVARSLKHDYENAEKILIEAESYIRNRNVEIARYWQLSSSCLVGVISAIFAFSFWGYRQDLIAAFGVKPFYIVLSSFAGSIGATMSIIFRIGNTSITSEAGHKLHLLEAISRNLGGAISGLIISILVCLGVVVPIFENSGMSNLAMVGGGLLAGASERWAPSLIAQFEKGKLLKQGG